MRRSLTSLGVTVALLIPGSQALAAPAKVPVAVGYGGAVAFTVSSMSSVSNTISGGRQSTRDGLPPGLDPGDASPGAAVAPNWRLSAVTE
ncbi:hypothetical protein ACFQ1S_32230 [Kibdelosporangium lantanae]|uniref:Uncharacterized protein n=1 Tax=Kibdelosporangium lantanae TaxID=1497396 RepID=A0ABW3MI66_9PSEU